MSNPLNKIWSEKLSSFTTKISDDKSEERDIVNTLLAPGP